MKRIIFSCLLGFCLSLSAADLSKDERDVMAFMVVDPDAWYDHAVETFGEEEARKFLAEKIRNHQAEYNVAKAKPNYKNRVKRDLESKATTP